MARRSMTGQLNMFDLLYAPEEETLGEVEMVSLVPEFEEEPKCEEIPEVEEVPEVEEISINEQSSEKVAMSRSYVISGVRIEIAYINYNKVRIIKGADAPIIKEFASSKEAVDYYVEQMQEYEVDE